MKIAIPTRGNLVDGHFGHCEMYSVFTINDNKIIETEILPSLVGCGCKSNIASVLYEKGVSIMLAGNMGEGAMNVLNMHNIEVIRGCSGDVNAVAEAYINGN
ncbi:MAG: NifB/NifX family molybdenum-iron cluster-binding protein [Bacteroidetes bacterium]|nr:NifB/NifX family molybdenum-iron cluster-binding protein [Bacteroidota bacterium]